MATQKGAKKEQKIVEQPEIEEPKVAHPFDSVPAMIEQMSRNCSKDLNKHQIQASILGRLETWATKIGLENEWLAELPKHLRHIKEAAEARHDAVQKFFERNRLEKARRVSRMELDAQ